MSYEVTVKLNATAPAGYFQEQVSLKTNDPSQQNARVPLVVQGYIVPTLSVNPTILMLGEVKSGESVSKNLVVRGGKPFRIASISGPDDQFRFTPPTEAKDVQVIGVQFNAGAKPGKIAGKIDITTDLGGAAVDVDVNGQVVAGDRPAPPAGAGASPAKPESPKPESPKPESPKPESPKSEAAKPESPKPEAAKSDSARPSLDAANPGINILRSPGKLKPVEPDARPSEK